MVNLPVTRNMYLYMLHKTIIDQQIGGSLEPKLKLELEPEHGCVLENEPEPIVEPNELEPIFETFECEHIAKPNETESSVEPKWPEPRAKPYKVELIEFQIPPDVSNVGNSYRRGDEALVDNDVQYMDGYECSYGTEQGNFYSSLDDDLNLQKESE